MEDDRKFAISKLGGTDERVDSCRRATDCELSVVEALIGIVQDRLVRPEVLRELDVSGDMFVMMSDDSF